jgi:hypothetical protein
MTTDTPRPKIKKVHKERSGVKETDNLFMDGWSWRRFNKRIDDEMTKRGLPPEKTPTFLKAEPV